MKAVFDSNVLIAALLSRRGTPAQLLRLWLEGVFELVVSAALLEELKRVLAYPKIRSRIDEAEAESFLALLSQAAQNADDPADTPSVRTIDPGDDYLVALAESTRAVIVSGDKHLLDLSRHLPVYTPAGFRELLEANDSD